MDYSNNLVIIGSSSGGPQTLKRVLARLPILKACVVIIQHMPKFINHSLCDSLSMATDMEVKLAKNGMTLEDGKVLIAPSETHLEFHRNRAVVLLKGEKVNFVCPAIDVAMKSIRAKPGGNVAAVILTGIGADGAKGLSHIKQIGGTTLAQNEATCVIYGMPKAAAATGNVDFVMTPEKIGDKIEELVNSWHTANPMRA